MTCLQHIGIDEPKPCFSNSDAVLLVFNLRHPSNHPTSHIFPVDRMDRIIIDALLLPSGGTLVKEAEVATRHETLPLFSSAFPSSGNAEAGWRGLVVRSLEVARAAWVEAVQTVRRVPTSSIDDPPDNAKDKQSFAQIVILPAPKGDVKGLGLTYSSTGITKLLRISLADVL